MMRKTLLIVDDAMIIREKIKDAARSGGWEILGEAAHGDEAIARYRELKPAVVTLDMVMPEYDGLHALRGIMEFDPHARVLVVSALDQTPVLKQALKLGARDFLVKPFAAERLLASLEILAVESWQEAAC